jgi:hypothetical protein
LEALGETVRKEILKEVKSTGMFSVIIDTTTDISKLDQFAFVLRYCSNDGDIFERLVCVDAVLDTTGKGMFEMFCKLCEKHELNWKVQLISQAYDGTYFMFISI